MIPLALGSGRMVVGSEITISTTEHMAGIDAQDARALAARGKMCGELGVEAPAEVGGEGESAVVADEDEDVVGAVEQRGAVAAVGEVLLHPLTQPGINIVIEVVRDLAPDLVTAHFHLISPSV